MEILVIALLAAVALLLAPRFLGRRQQRMLEQYEVLEKRFGFARHVTPSKWGKGIGEHFKLSGSYRGYPVSLYEHFHKSPGGRLEWTTLVFETLFADLLELRIEFSGTQEQARFGELAEGASVLEGMGCRLSLSDAAALEVLRSEGVLERVERFAEKKECGAVSLSKGFLEYREMGILDSEELRLRYQDALLLLAELADAISLHASKRKAKSLG